MSLPPPPVERAHPVRDWAARKAARAALRQARTEARAVDGSPRLSLRLPWTRDKAGRHGDQTLRAFIQINVLPRPR